MNDVDLRSMSDRQLFAYLLLGDLPRQGWPGRRRLIARRVLVLAGVATGAAIALFVLRLVVVFAWAVAS